MNTFECIKSRNSYRGKYKDEIIPKADLIKIMDAGLSAPSGCNKQTTSLIAIDDKETLRKVLDVIEPKVCDTAPALICVLSENIYAYRDKCYAIQDYSAAIENMLLEAVELGYSSCWIEGHITDTDRICDKIAKILDVPSNYNLVCILPIGHAIDEVKKPNKKDFNKRSCFNDFKNMEK